MAANQFYNWLYGNRDDELQEKLKWAKNDEQRALIQAEIDADTVHHQQELMNIAATAGASDGGSPVSHGGRMPYADTTMFNPKAMPQSITKEEDDEKKKLRAPGFATFGQPFRMYT